MINEIGQAGKKANLAIIAICVVVGCGLAYLIANMALDKGISNFWRIFLGVCGAAIILAVLYNEGMLPWKPRSKTETVVAKKSADIILGMATVFGFLSSVLSLITPTSVVESAPGAIENKVGQANAKIDELRKDIGVTDNAQALAKLAGTWGEPGCAVTYEIAIDKNALRLTSKKSPAGMEPFSSIGTITATTQLVGGSQSGVTVNTIEEIGEDRGKATSYTYEDNGAIDRITRRDHSSQVQLTLDRCT
jgi:hypothetical protein